VDHLTAICCQEERKIEKHLSGLHIHVVETMVFGMSECLTQSLLHKKDLNSILDLPRF